VRIHVDRDRCLGNARCSALAPEVFDNDDDGYVVVLQEPDESMRHTVEVAVQSCPTGALSLVE
jgi:ferredoxin